MRMIFYLVFLTLGVAIAPVVALGIALYTFAICFLGFVRGVHEGLLAAFFDIEKEEEKVKGVWEAHQDKLDKQNKNEK